MKKLLAVCFATVFALASGLSVAASEMNKDQTKPKQTTKHKTSKAKKGTKDAKTQVKK